MATTAFLPDNNRRLIVANVDDSYAILSRGGKLVEVSVDHEPQKPEEREMVSILFLLVLVFFFTDKIYQLDHQFL